MFSSRFALILLLAALSACTTLTQTSPPRSATEELLISTAADRAAGNLMPEFPKNAHVYLDAANFDSSDGKYAVAAIRESLMKHGARLVDSKKKADTVVEVRAGALSIDKKETLVGIPSFTIPVPFAASGIVFPQIALYAKEDQKGVAKFTAVDYGAKSGVLREAPPPQYGFAHRIKKTLLIFINWTENDTMPEKTLEKSDEVSSQPSPSSQPAPAPSAKP